MIIVPLVGFEPTTLSLDGQPSEGSRLQSDCSTIEL